MAAATPITVMLSQLVVDVALSSPANGEAFGFDSVAGKWKNTRSLGPLTLTAQADADVPLTLKAHSGSQSGNFLQCLASDGTTALANIGISPKVFFELNGKTTGSRSDFSCFDGPDSGNAAYAAFGIDNGTSSFGVAGVCLASGKNGSGVLQPFNFLMGGVAVAQIQTNGTLVVGTGAGAANTSFDGIALVNPTPATSGNQSFGPRLRLTGQGWKTTSVAGSQTVDWTLENRPVQGTANPSSNLVFASQINGGGYADVLTLTPGGVRLGTGSISTPQIAALNQTDMGFWFSGGAMAIVFSGVNRFTFDSSNNYVGLSADGAFTWSNTIGNSSATQDCGFARASAGTIRVTNGTSGGGGLVVGVGIATTATDGFLYVPTCAGAPTGTPTTQTGTCAMVYDTADDRLCIYNGGWKKVALT